MGAEPESLCSDSLALCCFVLNLSFQLHAAVLFVIRLCSDSLSKETAISFGLSFKI